MHTTNANVIKELLLNSNFSVDTLHRGPTSIFIGNTQFNLSVKNDNLIVKEAKLLFCKKYTFPLSSFHSYTITESTSVTNTDAP